ncbi:TPA: hypothetical protein DCZ15_02450 [Candidatus Falkowbacteria bacterium]|nr:MAG: hypothetical protein UV95_C0001G0116 [Candidatus Falkowbacteria bacterium GW2011_GWF2_43_32]HBA36715.1 hypothetical protein [Candidatus Falkowbacteria bacterium]
MDYQLQLKSFEGELGFKHKILQITDITLHSSDRQPTKSIGKKIRQAFSQKKPGRFYGFKIQEPTGKQNSVEAVMELVKKDPELMKVIQEEEKNGYRIFIGLPKDGVPILLGEDAKEFINSKNGQRVIRGINH